MFASLHEAVKVKNIVATADFFVKCDFFVIDSQDKVFPTQYSWSGSPHLFSVPADLSL